MVMHVQQKSAARMDAIITFSIVTMETPALLTHVIRFWVVSISLGRVVVDLVWATAAVKGRLVTVTATRYASTLVTVVQMLASLVGIVLKNHHYFALFLLGSRYLL